MQFLMQFLANMALLFCLLLGCQQADQTPSIETALPTIVKIKSLQEIVGYILTCETPNGKAHVYVFAPHILGLWDDPQAKRIEYFVSQFLTKNSELAYELLITGEPNMQTHLLKLGDLKNRRIMMRIRDGKIFIMVAHGLNEKDKTPINPNQFECIRGPRIAEKVP
ncbi:MAG: hypothetical protein AABY86_02180 [Bdellovibrionota bacterium]